MTTGHTGVIMDPSRRSAGVARLLGRSVRPIVDGWIPEGYRLRAMRGVAATAGIVRSPFGTRVWRERSGSVHGLWVRGRNSCVSTGVLLYLHGGGYVVGSSRSHFSLVKRLSTASGLAAFLVDYRRAPEHPFPAAADDALAAYRILLERGIGPDRIAVVGDSVGGHLVATLLGDLTRHQLPMPSAAVMLSPALDPSGAGAQQRDLIVRDPVISPASGLRCLQAYLGATDLSHPRVAVLDGDLSGWPPVLIQAGDTECLLGDSERMAEQLAAADVLCDLQVWPGQVHVFQALARYLPEGRAAIGHAGHFLAEHVEAAQSAE